MHAVKFFDFRINHERTTGEALAAGLKDICLHYAFQGETGAQTGYRHWQGRLSFNEKIRRTGALGKWQAKFGWAPNYLQPTASPTARSLGIGFYVHKNDTYDGKGRWSDSDDHEEYVPVQHRVELRPWQRTVIESAEIRDDRVIDVIIDPIGGIGKSVLAGVARNRGFHGIPSCGDAERLIATVCNILCATRDRKPGLFILDLPRSSNKTKLHAFMHAIETIKNGWVYDTRYQYKQWMFDAPRVWIMSNSRLPSDYMSNDRWRLWEVENDELIRFREPAFTTSTGETINLNHEVAMLGDIWL